MYPVTFLVFGRPRLAGVQDLEAHYRRLLRGQVRLRPRRQPAPGAEHGARDHGAERPPVAELHGQQVHHPLAQVLERRLRATDPERGHHHMGGVQAKTRAWPPHHGP